MVDKKVVAGAAILALGVGAYALSKAEAAPVEEGAPEGEVSSEITEIQGYSFDDVQGLDEGWGEDATINVNGRCTSGYPVPAMVIERWDGPTTATATKRDTLNVPIANIGETFTLTNIISGKAETGVHVVYGKMRLTNQITTIEYRSATPDLTFEIGIEAPGEITIDVTLA